MKKLAITYLLFLLCFPVQAQSIKKVVDDYIETYRERNDWDKFLSFYDDSVYMKDILLGYECKGLEAFKQFYDWPNANFKKLTPTTKTFEVEDIVIDSKVAIIRGYFNSFYWKHKKMDWPEGFTIWLYFNKEKKINKQLDYLHYPSDILKLMGR